MQVSCSNPGIYLYTMKFSPPVDDEREKRRLIASLENDIGKIRIVINTNLGLPKRLAQEVRTTVLNTVRKYLLYGINYVIYTTYVYSLVYRRAFSKQHVRMESASRSKLNFVDLSPRRRPFLSTEDCSRGFCRFVLIVSFFIPYLLINANG